MRAAQAGATQLADGGSPAASGLLEAPCTFVFIPGLFMTLETTESLAQAVQSTNPHATIICIGIAGQPATHWPRTVPLTVAQQVQGLDKLFEHLRSRQIWDPRQHGTATFVAFDLGAHIRKCRCAVHLIN